MPLYSPETYRRAIAATNSTFGSCEIVFMYEPTDPYSLYLFLRRTGHSGAPVMQLYITDREQFADVMMTDGAISDYHGKVIVSNAHQFGFVCVELVRGGDSHVYLLDFEEVWHMLGETWELVPEGDEHDAMANDWNDALARLLQGGEAR